MKKKITFLVSGLLTVLPLQSVFAEELIWGIQAEQFEYRYGESGEDLLAWDFDAVVGTDELKIVWRSEAEYELNSNRFETLENQLRLQTPISDFFDAVAGIRIDTPDGTDRVSGVLGVHGLTKQWFEVDADLFLSEHPSARFEVEYEGLITNYITLTPSFEIDIPFTDDEDFEYGAWGPKIELGARLSYDLVDRAISPYIGIHYERSFGKTRRLAKSEGGESDAIFGVIGVKIMF